MLEQTTPDHVAAEEILPSLTMDGLTMKAITPPHSMEIRVFSEVVMGLYSLLSNTTADLGRQFRVVSSSF